MAPVRKLPPNLSESSPRPAPVSDTVPSIERPASNNDNNKTPPGKKRGRKKSKGKSQNDKPKDKSPIAAEDGKGKAQPTQIYILRSSDKFLISSSRIVQPLPSIQRKFELQRLTSRDSSPSGLQSPPPPIYSAAAVVYEDPSEPLGWRGFGLRGVLHSREAELYGVNQALQLALDTLQPEPPQITVSILTDSQDSLRMIKEHLTSKKAKPYEVAEAAASKAVKLREREIPLELRWVPGYKKLPGNMVADTYAADARAASENNKASSIGKITPWTRPELPSRKRRRRESSDSSSTSSSTRQSPSQESD
ncbi:hypothetical protein BJX65DRAFT_313150 [Aspergillus insuetus]